MRGVVRPQFWQTQRVRVLDIINLRQYCTRTFVRAQVKRGLQDSNGYAVTISSILSLVKWRHVSRVVYSVWRSLIVGTFLPRLASNEQ